MKGKFKKRKLAGVLGTFNLGEITTMETGNDGTFCHDEAGVIIVLEATQSGQCVIPYSNDKDVFVLLVYWANRTDTN